MLGLVPIVTVVVIALVLPTSLRKIATITAVIVLCAYLFTFWQTELQRSRWIPTVLEGTEIEVRGTIVEMPIVKNGYVQFLMRLEPDLSMQNPDFKQTGMVLLSC